MKRKLLVTVVILVIWMGSQSKAQYHDIKTNFLGFIFGNYGLLYEYGINENMTVGGGANFFLYTVKIGDSSTYKWTGYNIAPEFWIIRLNQFLARACAFLLCVKASFNLYIYI